MGFVEIAGSRLEVEIIAATRPGADLVFLHEGLGSISLWRDFPARVADAAGGRAILYSRAGYGRSSPLVGPRTPDYMHREAREVLPALLRSLDIANPVLVGHSDGASIALIHAAGHPVRGLALMAPHVFVEDISVAGIAAARRAWETTDLRERLARHHEDAEGAFRGWNDIWLDAAFRDWNIEALLPRIACPILAIQGRDDEYGTVAQVEAIARQAAGPVELVVLDRCGHSPYREATEESLAAITSFIAGLQSREGKIAVESR